MSSAALPRVPDHIVSTRFDGAEGVLIDLEAKRYYTLNETAMLVWDALEKGVALDEIVARMVAAYAVEPGRAAESVTRLLAELRSLKLVTDPPV